MAPATERIDSIDWHACLLATTHRVSIIRAEGAESIRQRHTGGKNPHSAIGKVVKGDRIFFVSALLHPSRLYQECYTPWDRLMDLEIASVVIAANP